MVDHTILVITYHLIKDKKDFYDLGADYFEKQKKQSIVKKTVKRLESLDYKVTIQEDGISRYPIAYFPDISGIELPALQRTEEISALGANLEPCLCCLDDIFVHRDVSIFATLVVLDINEAGVEIDIGQPEVAYSRHAQPCTVHHDNNCPVAVTSLAINVNAI